MSGERRHLKVLGLCGSPEARSWRPSHILTVAFPTSQVDELHSPKASWEVLKSPQEIGHVPEAGLLGTVVPLHSPGKQMN